jgi:hypothetical protein
MCHCFRRWCRRTLGVRARRRHRLCLQCIGVWRAECSGAAILKPCDSFFSDTSSGSMWLPQQHRMIALKRLGWRSFCRSGFRHHQFACFRVLTQVEPLSTRSRLRHLLISRYLERTRDQCTRASCRLRVREVHADFNPAAVVNHCFL